MEPSDRELMARLATGDRDALEPLMARHQRRLYRIALGYLRDPDLALDAVQETFVKAFQSAARWDGRAEVAPWLVRIAVNESIDQYR
jgi:RNA polymerase sigma-70 factor (ECF subfamily)